MEDADPAARILQLIREASLSTAAVTALPSASLPTITIVIGNENVVGGIAVNSERPPRFSRPDPGSNRGISPDQGDHLVDLVAQWVNTCREGHMRFGVDMAWAEFNAAMQVRSYLHLHRTEFAEAVDWLLDRISDARRNAIHARTRSQ